MKYFLLFLVLAIIANFSYASSAKGLADNSKVDICSQEKIYVSIVLKSKTDKSLLIVRVKKGSERKIISKFTCETSFRGLGKSTWDACERKVTVHGMPKGKMEFYLDENNIIHPL